MVQSDAKRIEAIRGRLEKLATGCSRPFDCNSPDDIEWLLRQLAQAQSRQLPKGCVAVSARLFEKTRQYCMEAHSSRRLDAYCTNCGSRTPCHNAHKQARRVLGLEEGDGDG